MKHSIAKISILCLTVAIGLAIGLKYNVGKHNLAWVNEIRMGYAVSINDDKIRNSAVIAEIPMWRGNFGKTLLFSGFSGLIAEKKSIPSIIKKTGLSAEELQIIVKYLQVSGLLEQWENQGLDITLFRKFFSTLPDWN